MANIQYADFITEVKDLINNLVKTKVINDPQRESFTIDNRLARAANYAVHEFVKNAVPESVPDLIEEKTLTAVRTSKNVSSFRFPNDAYTERSDSGFLLIIIDGKELSWDEQISLEEVENRVGSSYYGHYFPCFAADTAKRRFYAPYNSTFIVEQITRPTPITTSTTEIPIQDNYLDDVAALAVQRITGMSLTESTSEQNQADE